MNTPVRIPDLEKLFREVDSFIPGRENNQPPLIGISANRKDGLSCIADPYVQAVVSAGGAPVLLPVITDIPALTALVNTLDGIILSGGGDINPLFLHEEPIPGLQDIDTFRDEYDLILLRLAGNRQIPMMGICRGHQLMNIAFGGSMYQDIRTQAEEPLIKHSQQQPREFPSHSVILTPDTTLHALLEGESKIVVNSIHHQAVKEVAPGFRETALAPDGINEGFEHPEKPVWGIQWHPETMAANGDPTMSKLFKYHIRQAHLFKQTRAIHSSILTIDSHTDTPMIFPGNFDLGIKQGGKVNLPYMEEGHIDAVFMVAYIPQGARDDDSLVAATTYATERLQEVKRQETLYPDRMGIAYTPTEVLRLKEQGRKAVLLGIENGYAIGKDINNISKFKEAGVSYITLCHNGDNDLCDSVRGNREWGGLSPFGKEVIAEMNRQGIMIDLSHASEDTFYDVLQYSRKPVIASHSSARALCDHPRNLTDEQIKALAAKDGVVQVCLYKGFINPEEEKASLSDAIRHINHIVSLVGTSHVGIGSDFDGDGELIGCSATNELINITMRLLEEGYAKDDIEKIWGGNLLRVMRSVQASEY